MSAFAYRRGMLACDRMPAEKLATRFGTPLYVYSAREICERFRAFAAAFAAARPLVCYSVKANGNLSVLRLLAKEGSGFDIVSEGELFRVMRAGGRADRIVFAGVGKTDAEIEAALRARVLLLNVESDGELLRIEGIARRLRVRAKLALRVNPDVDPKTHVYITTGKKENKFGVDLALARRLLREARRLRAARIVGLHVHIGSMVLSPGPYERALRRLRVLFREFPEGRPEWIDLGGGFGISYHGKRDLDLQALGRALGPLVAETGARLVLEPGRYIVGPAGVLLTRVVGTKRSGRKTFVIVDAGMNDFVRPSLYSAFHRIVPVRPRKGNVLADVVGPICESADFFAQDRVIPSVREGDLLAVLDVGAYGFSMASQYNSRARPAEVLVDRSEARLARRRESREDLIRGEL